LKEYLQVTISKRKGPRTKIGRWLFWRIYWPVWKVWRPNVLSKIFFAISQFFLLLLPKEEREKLKKEYEEIDVVIKFEDE